VIALPHIKIGVPKLFLTSLFKTPLREYKDPSLENEKPISLGRLPNIVWLEIYQYLDPRSLVKLIASCKKLILIANDDRIRKKLYSAQETQKINGEGRAFLHLASPHKSSVDLLSPRLSQSLLSQPIQMNRSQFMQEKEVYVYNDNPLNGFIMKGVLFHNSITFY